MFEVPKIKNNLGNFTDGIVDFIKNNVQDQDMVDFVLKKLSDIKTIKTINYGKSEYIVTGDNKKKENVSFSIKFLPSMDLVTDIEVEYIEGNILHNYSSSKKNDSFEIVDYRKSRLDGDESFVHRQRNYTDNIISYILNELNDEKNNKSEVTEHYIMGNLVECKKLSVSPDGTQSISYYRKELENNVSNKSIKKGIKSDLEPSSEENFNNLAVYHKSCNSGKERPNIFKKK